MQTAIRSAVLFVCIAAFAAAQALPKGVQRVTSVEGITEYKLENGLSVLLFPDPAKQTITVNITYLVGSRHEGYGETGMAHLLEHLLFLGSPRHPNMNEEFRKYGARRNGSTWFDRTNYFETFPATDDHLKWALDLESDRMVNAFVSKEQLDKEMTVVRNEFEMGENSPQRVLNQRTMAAAFDWHNYGKTTIGAKADLENVPIERLKAFYQRYYQPDNAVLTVAGKIDEPKTLALIADYFGKVPRPARKLERTYTLDPVQDGERTVTVKRVGDVQALNVVYKVPDGAHPDIVPLSVLSSLMSTAPSGRLHKALVETQKATMVGSGVMQLREPGVFSLSASVRKEADLEDAKNTMLRVLHDVVKEPPTKEEVDRARQAYLSNIDLTLADSDRVGLMLSEPAAAGDWRLIFLFRDRLKKVTPEDVLRVAKTYIKEDNRTVGRFIPVEKPDRAELPPPTDVATVLRDFKGGAAVTAGEAFDPTPDNIEKRTVRKKLPDGIKLVLLPKKTRANSVHAIVALRFGDVESLKGQRHASMLTASMLNRGTKKHTRQQLRDEFDRLKARVMPGGSGPTATVMIETTRQSLAEAVTLAVEMLREPVFPADEFEQLKQQMLAAQEQRRSDPNSLAQIAMMQHVQPYARDDVRYTASADEDMAAIKAVTLDDVKKFHASFYGASNAEVVVVGDHDPAEMESLTAKLLGGWKSPQRFAELRNTYRGVPAVNKAIETPDKANATFFAALPLQISDKHPDYPALALANYIFGGGAGNRLFSRIRTKEGLSYGTSSQFMARAKDESGLFAVFAIANPTNVPKVESVLKEMLDGVVKEGFTAEEIAQAKKGWAESRLVMRSNDQMLVSIMRQLSTDDRTMAYHADLDAKISNVTPQQVSDAFRKYIVPAELSYFKAGDFKKAAAQ